MPRGARRRPGALSRALSVILSQEAEEQGLSGRTLAAMVHMSQPQMAGHLRGDVVLNVEELQAVCSALGLDLVDVVHDAVDAMSRHS